MKAIEIISIPVTNQEKAKKFYTNQLGFNILFEGDTPQGKWIQLSLPDDTTSISLISNHGEPGSVKGNIIASDDIEEDVIILRNKGLVLPDIQIFPHGKITTFSDPDGNQWVLREVPKY